MTGAAHIARTLLEDDDFDPKEFVMGAKLRLNPPLDKVKFYLWVEPEDRWPPDWHEGDTPQERRQHARMLRRMEARLEAGDYWAYGVVFVMAKYTAGPCDETDDEELTYYGDAVLGGCSYKSAIDFMRCGDYFEDMKVEAYDELQKNFDNGLTGPRVRGHEPPDGSEVPARYSKLRL